MLVYTMKMGKRVDLKLEDHLPALLKVLGLARLVASTSMDDKHLHVRIAYLNERLKDLEWIQFEEEKQP